MKLHYSAKNVAMQRILLITPVFVRLKVVGFVLAINMGDCARNTLKNKLMIIKTYKMVFVTDGDNSDRLQQDLKFDLKEESLK